MYIGRPSKWGNPYSHKFGSYGVSDLIKVDTIEDAVRCYETYIKLMIEWEPEKYNLDELRGRVLGCYCKPGLCHGDVLARLCDVEDN